MTDKRVSAGKVTRKSADQERFSLSFKTQAEVTQSPMKITFYAFEAKADYILIIILKLLTSFSI